MKTVIKPGNTSYIHTCTHCKCVFSYQIYDCSHFVNYSITCPECHVRQFVKLTKEQEVEVNEQKK